MSDAAGTFADSSASEDSDGAAEAAGPSASTFDGNRQWVREGVAFQGLSLIHI